MFIDCKEASRLLAEQDNIVILCHAKPDGDTLGAAFALLYTLESLGKTARVESPDGLPGRYGYLYEGYQAKAFEPGYVVAVDIAGPKLLGSLEEKYRDCVDLCIDHHKSNDDYAKYTFLDVEAAATAEAIYRVAVELGTTINKAVANAIFTGLTTDTGCFKYGNVTSNTHRTAAAVIDGGAEHAKINKLMFQTKSRGRVAVDKMMMDNLEFHLEGRCAVIPVPADVKERFGVQEEELDGIAAFPTTIEGVQAGITLRDKGDGIFRVSVRSEGDVDASKICATFGGGGHRNAAGCTASGTAEEVLARLLEAVKSELEH